MLPSARSSEIEQASDTSAFGGLKSLAGTLELDSGAVAVGSLTTTGDVDVVGGELTANSFTQTGGSTTVAAGATLKAGSSGTGAIKVSGGQLSGAGTLEGATTLSGSSSLVVDVESTVPTLTVQGTATLGGTLAITTLTPPTTGTRFTPLAATHLAGQFGTVTGGEISAGLYYVPSYTSTDVLLTVGPPVLTSVTPAAVGAGASAVTVQLAGAGLVTGATIASPETGVTFSSPLVASDGYEITAKLSVASTAKPGKLNVSVDETGGPLTCTGCLVIDAGPAFKDGSSKAFSPDSLPAASSSKAVTIAGSGFAKGIKVTFSGSGVTAKVSSVTSSKLTLKVTTKSTAKVGKYSVTLVNLDGGTATCKNCFSVTKKASGIDATGASRPDLARADRLGAGRGDSARADRSRSATRIARG